MNVTAAAMAIMAEEHIDRVYFGCILIKSFVCGVPGFCRTDWDWEESKHVLSATAHIS
jgi:hypothetical protein